MLRPFRLAALTAFCLSGPVWAETPPAREAECRLIVAGTEIINGPCEVSETSPDGSFTMATADAKYTAYVLMDEAAGRATGFWNGAPYGALAHEKLGALTLRSGCWVSPRVALCAR